MWEYCARSGVRNRCGSSRRHAADRMAEVSSRGRRGRRWWSAYAVGPVTAGAETLWTPCTGARDGGDSGGWCARALGTLVSSRPRCVRVPVRRGPSCCATRDGFETRGPSAGDRVSTPGGAGPVRVRGRRADAFNTWQGSRRSSMRGWFSETSGRRGAEQEAAQAAAAASTAARPCVLF